MKLKITYGDQFSLGGKRAELVQEKVICLNPY